MRVVKMDNAPTQQVNNWIRLGVQQSCMVVVVYVLLIRVEKI